MKKNAEVHEVEEDRVDAFEQRVEEFTQSLKKEDIDLTIALANKPADGTKGQPRLDFIDSTFELRSEPDHRNRPAVPKVLQGELKKVVPGWVAQESRYKEDAVSKKKAKGYWQIKPKVYEELRGTKKVSQRADDQTEAAGEHVSDNYHYILHFAGEEALSVLQHQFPSKEQFLKDMMAPLMITAYNVGGPGIGKMIKKFVEAVPQEELQTGKDLFIQFIDFAKEVEGLSEEGSEYATAVHGFNEEIKKEMEKIEKEDRNV